VRASSTGVVTALRAGVAVSFLLIVAGLLLAFTQPPTGAIGPGELRGLPAAIASLHGASLIHLGILVLILTPFMRVVVLVGHFARQRDLSFVLVSFGVLLLLITTIVIGLLWEAPR
jgi:uncharacterized membrane protein